MACKIPKRYAAMFRAEGVESVDVIRTGGHIIVRLNAPGGDHIRMTIEKTASDRRAFLNNRARVRQFIKRSKSK